MKNYILILLLPFLAACNQTTTVNNQSDDFLTDKMKRLISISEAQSTKGEQIIRLNGKVSSIPDAQINIPPLVSGKVIKVNVQLGDQVKKGDVLAIISSNELTDLQNELIAAQNNLVREEKEHQAARSLFNDGLLSNQEMATAEAELNIARAEVNKVLKQLSILDGNESAEYQIKTPIDGIIEARNIQTNTFVSEDFEEPLFTITNLNEVLVNLLISESNMRYIKEGLTVKLQSLAYPDKEYQASINRVVRVLDPESKVIKAQLKINNEGQYLLPEMFVRSEVSVQSDDLLVAVPSSSVIFDNGQHFVVKETGNNQFQNQAVEIWGRNNDSTFLSNGLEPGDKVVSQYPLLVFTQLQNNERYGE